MKKVTIIDYGMCNLDSIARAVQECGGNAVVTDRPKDLGQASYLILPGVGAFPDAMSNIRARSLEDAMYEQAIVRQIPFLGVCLGMQLLAERGHEGRETRGLGWIPGEVTRLRPQAGERIPHIGWDEVNPEAGLPERECPLFRGIPPGKDFYFVHSFHLCCEDTSDVAATTPYCGGFTSVIGRGLIFGVQFHPEKSQKMGFRLLHNFLSL